MNQDADLLSFDHPTLKNHRMKHSAMAEAFQKAENRLFWKGFTYGGMAAFVIFCIAAFFWGGF